MIAPQSLAAPLEAVVSALTGEPASADAALAAFDPAFVASIGASVLAQELLSYAETLRSGSLADSSEGALVLHVPEGLVEVTGATGPGGLLVSFSVTRTGPGAGVTWEALLEQEPAATGASALEEGLTATLNAIVDSGRVAQQLPGLLAAVADRDGNLVWTRQLGVGTARLDAAPSAETVLRIGSITKTMTAILVMQLVDQGRLGLDDDVNDHLTAYDVAGPVTVRQLLTHTSGLGNRPGVPIACPPGAEPRLADFYGPVLVGQGPPSNEFVYSNDAFATLGQLVEDVTGVPLVKHAAQALFGPLGMTRSSLAQVPGELFQGLHVVAGELAPIPFQAIALPAAGSVFSTLRDMALYGAALHGFGANRHGRVLSERAFKQLVQPQHQVGGVPFGASMCLGWLRLHLGGVEMLWHNGGWPGAKSEIGVLPALGYTVLLFTNTMESDVDALCMQLAQALVAAS